MPEQTAIARVRAASAGGLITAPQLAEDYALHALTGANIAALRENFGLRVSGRSEGNFVFLHRNFARLPAEAGVHFEFDNNILVLDEKLRFAGRISMERSGICILLGHQHTLNLDAMIYDGSCLLWGRGARTYGCRIWVHGARMAVIGDDCMFSEGITIRTSDHHAIIDLETMRQVNAAEDVIIEGHVWVGPDCSILRGACIGRGSIIGAGSVVTQPIPATELWAGVPARCVRQNVSWVDEYPASPERIRELGAALGRHGSPE